MDDVTRMAAETALRRMFRAGGWLDICLIDKLVKVTGVVPPEAEYRAASLLHCVHWSEMSPELRNEMARRIVGWFLSDQFDPFAVEVAAVGALTTTQGG